MSMTQLDDFVSLFGEDLSAFDGNNPAFLVTGETLEIKANEPFISTEVLDINGHQRELTVRTTFINPTLTSVQLRRTDATNYAGRIDFNATVVSERVLEVEIVPGSWMNIADLAVGLIRRANPSINKSDTAILQNLRTYGFDPSARLPMYLQHLGASESAFDAIAEHLKSIGGRDVTDETRRRATGQKSHLVAQIRHDEGVLIGQMDISRSDRSRSESNSGFIGHLDASFSVFRAAVAFDHERTILKKVIEADPTNTDAIRRATEIREMFSTGIRLRAFRNWGGVSRRENHLMGTVEYYAQQVPCGRLSVIPVSSDGVRQAPHRYSVWSTAAANRQEENVSAALDQLADTLTPPTSDSTEAF